MENLPLSFPKDSPYHRLASALDALPNRFPPAPDESHLRVLAALFTPEEAGMAACLVQDLETPVEIAARLGRDQRELMGLLKEMTRKGLIAFGKTAQGKPGFGILPFIVGFYEEQIGRLDKTTALLVEEYFQSAFRNTLRLEPQFHRVIPVNENIKSGMEIRPFESATSLIDRAQSWGVMNCICRVQKSLIGQSCGHPVDVCMVLNQNPDAFRGNTTIRALTRDEALSTLQRAAEAGLVHCVSNFQQDVTYICNCCTCSCGILRGMAEAGIVNVVARSPFVSAVDESLCVGCGICADTCSFNAISVNGTARVQELRCVGCGLCASACPQEAIGLVRRPGESAPPLDEKDWGHERLKK